MKPTPRRYRDKWSGQSLLSTLAVFLLGILFGSISLQQHSSALGDIDQAFEPFWDAFAIIESRYVDPVPIEQLVDGAIAGMVDALEDDHSGYIRPELCDRAVDFSGEFSGIGVTIATIDDTGEIEVVTVIPNSPAESAGVMPGDIFYEIDGQAVTGMTQAELSAIVPGPRGTVIAITFKRDSELVTFEIVRDIFTLPNVSYAMLADNIAHIEMKDFNNLSRQQLDDAFDALDIDETTGLIFDIRGNPGGTLASAIEIGSAFIEDGVLLRQVSRNHSEEVTRTSGGYAEIDVPIVVLVDETSASASEVIAGAMQDYGVATIIGETTFGKGTVQNIPYLSNDGCVRITVKRWLTPNGHWIHDQGITPDIIIEWNQDDEEAGGIDLQLEAALDFLESLRD